MQDDFFDNYIVDSIKNGYASPREICNRALMELDEIDKKIRETNNLRIRYKNLKQVLKSFDHESTKKIKNNIELLNDYNVNTLYNHVIINICSFIEKQEKSVSSREIIDNVGNREQHQEIYMGIKYLCDNGILSRKEDRSFIIGLNWNDRPIKDIKNVS